MRKNRTGLMFFKGEFRVQKNNTQTNSEILCGLPGSSKKCTFIELKLLMINLGNREDCVHLFKFIFPCTVQRQSATQ